MSWTPHNEANFQEGKLLVDAMQKQRNEFLERFDLLICRIRDADNFFAMMESHAGEIRDLLKPFDTKGRPECETVAAERPNFREVPLTHGGSAFVYRADVEELYKQLAAIAQAVKPLRDWYYAENRPEGLLCLSSYGHEVRNGDFVKLFDVCPRPGQIVDEHA